MKPAENLAKDVGRLVVWYPFRWLAQALPFRIVGAMGSLLAWGDWILSGSRRLRRMEGNIATALGSNRSGARRILLANLRNHAMNMIEFMKYPQMTEGRCRQLIVWEGRERLDEALSQHRGVVLCTAHYGAKQILQVALGHAGYHVNQINYHLEGDRLSFIQKSVAQRNRLRIEQSIPCRFISAKGFLRSAFRCLQTNELLLVAADGVGSKDFMDHSFRPYSFLGQTMRFPTNYVSLARRTGAALVPAFAVREGFRHRIVIHPPLDAQAADAVDRYVRLLETYVRKYPHLWEFWEEFEEGELLAQ